MLRFNVSNKHFAYNRFQISIHPMLRFNSFMRGLLRDLKEFQYILCYGSTRPFIKCKFGIINFNTSYVTVQLYLPTLLNQSHLNFNTSYVTVQQSYCIHKITAPFDFNTSYVTVQQELVTNIPKMMQNFNTSYVTVQPLRFI